MNNYTQATRNLAKKVAAVCASFLTTLITYASNAEPVTTPNTFVDGQPALATQVNANFQAHQNAISNIKSVGVYVGNIKIGSVFSDAWDGNKGWILWSSGFVSQNVFVNVADGEGISALFMPQQAFSAFLYESTDCSGQAFVTNKFYAAIGANYNTPSTITSSLSSGVLFTDAGVNSSWGPFPLYYAKGALKTIGVGSKRHIDSYPSICESAAFSANAVEAYPNNPTITGVNTTNCLMGATVPCIRNPEFKVE